MSEREKRPSQNRTTQAKVTSTTYKPKNCNTHSDFPRQVQTMVNVYFVTVYYITHDAKEEVELENEVRRKSYPKQASKLLFLFNRDMVS